VKLVADFDCRLHRPNVRCTAPPGGAGDIGDRPPLDLLRSTGRPPVRRHLRGAGRIATHGLIDRVRATCFPALQGKLDPAYVSNERVVVDGNCVTSQGPATAIEFALTLVELLLGPAKAREVGSAMLFGETSRATA
jgi:putative intracellular protease/amidase